MAPRNPLASVNNNVLPATRRRPAGKKGKEQTAVKEENDALKAQIADLTSQLGQAKLEPTVPEKANASEKKNPFGGSLPVSVPFSSLGVAPKRPLTAFQRFSRDKREELKASLQDASVQEINAKLGEMWKSASAEEQAPYLASVEDDRLRYAREMEQFNQQKNKAETEKMALEYWANETKQRKAMEFYEAHLAKMKETEKKSGPVAPKQPRSAYHFFASVQHKELAKQNISLGEAAGQIAEEWNKLQMSKAKKSQALLKKYKQLALEDESRHKTELEGYQMALDEISEKEAMKQQEFRNAALEAYAKKTQAEEDVKAYRRIQLENKEAAKQERKKAREEKMAAKAAKADEPKRPRTAYAIFFGDNAATVSEYIKANNVEHSMAKEIGDRWKGLNARQKQKYERAAEADRKRFDEEMKEYAAKKGDTQNS